MYTVEFCADEVLAREQVHDLRCGDFIVACALDAAADAEYAVHGVCAELVGYVRRETECEGGGERGSQVEDVGCEMPGGGTCAVGYAEGGCCVGLGVALAFELVLMSDPKRDTREMEVRSITYFQRTRIRRPESRMRLTRFALAFLTHNPGIARR